MSAPVYLLATRSEGKLRELRPLFEAAGIRVVSLDEAGILESADEEGIESFATFEENALAKARWFHERSGGLPAIADDSGLVVDALAGAPGVHSRRWSGDAGLTGRALDEANNVKLLSSLEGAADRRARYVCAAALADTAGELVRYGETEGEILQQRSHGVHGFGYDPFFHSSELGRSFSEASLEEKERVSHRGRAFRALIEAMRGRA